MTSDALLALWFFVPAGAANMAPVFAAKLPFLKAWDAPIDGGRTFLGKPVLGPHKTWRGLLSGILIGTIVFAIQKAMVSHIVLLGSFTASINYPRLSVFVLGPLFGIGALGGDALKSFFKRRVNVPSGSSWFPFDQIDYILGGIVATVSVVRLTIAQYVWVTGIWLVLHIIVSYFGYRLHLKENPI